MQQMVHEYYDPQRILLSFAISFIGAYMATSLCEQLRAHYIHHKQQSDIWVSMKWFALVGIALGAIGIWSMHFIGMSALTLNNGNIEMYYHIGTSIASLLVVIVTTTCGVVMSSFDPMFMKTKGEILEMFIADTSQLSLAEIRNMKNSRLFWIISTKSLHYLLLGGLIAGSGVSIMHYIGMEAMTFNGYIKWNPGAVAGSVIIALIASSAAFWILFRLLSLFPNKEILRLSCSLIMAAAVCGMHYTGMVAAEMHWDGSTEERHYGTGYMRQRDSFYPVLIAALIAVVIITIVLLEDLRKLVHTLPTSKQRYTQPWNSSLKASSTLKPTSSLNRMTSFSFGRFGLLKVHSKVVSINTAHTVSSDVTDLSLKRTTDRIAEDEEV